MLIRSIISLSIFLALSITGSGRGSASENFRFAPSLPSVAWAPPVHEATGGHGFPGHSLPTQIKGEVIGTTSNEYATFGLTDKGEIFWSRDGQSWTVIDFNEMYRGYYAPVHLVGIAAGAGSVAVVGTYEESGAPAMFVSQRGSVWSERTLTYSQGEELFELGEAPLAIRADLERDEYVLTCTDDVLFFVPSCSHCNRLEYHGTD